MSYISIQQQIRDSKKFSDEKKNEIIDALNIIERNDILRIEYQYDERFFQERNVPANLAIIMIWHLTPQGHDYWSNIHNLL